MKVEEHCASSLKKLGKEFREVHEWLDYYCGKNGRKDNGEEHYYAGYSLIKHRRERHHYDGIEECRKLFGNEGAVAARLHIEEDFFGYVPDKFDYYRKEFWDEIGQRAHYI